MHIYYFLLSNAKGEYMSMYKCINSSVNISTMEKIIFDRIESKI